MTEYKLKAITLKLKECTWQVSSKVFGTMVKVKLKKLNIEEYRTERPSIIALDFFFSHSWRTFEMSEIHIRRTSAQTGSNSKTCNFHDSKIQRYKICFASLQVQSEDMRSWQEHFVPPSFDWTCAAITGSSPSRNLVTFNRWHPSISYSYCWYKKLSPEVDM